MPERPRPLQVLIDGRPLELPGPVTVIAALAIAGIAAPRRSRSGQARGALCGMGICHECRAGIDGVAHQRACLVPCRDGMRITTDA